MRRRHVADADDGEKIVAIPGRGRRAHPPEDRSWLITTWTRDTSGDETRILEGREFDKK